MITKGGVMIKKKIEGSRYCCIVIWLKGGKIRAITHGDLQDAKQTEKFPRALCTAANVPFAKPIINDSSDNRIWVELYPKIDLQWPQKCANCLRENTSLEIKNLKIEKDFLKEDPAHNRVGPDSINLKIPYCPDCNPLNLNKAVKDNSFDGVVAILEFKNEKYAHDFIQLNS